MPINVLALDVGGRRIGMARGDTDVKVPRLLPTLEMTDDLFDKLTEIVTYEGIDVIVVGYPRNLSGQATEQTNIIVGFADQLRQKVGVTVEFQDESLTSVRAEEVLQARGQPYTRADIDAESAAIILADYLEQVHEAR